MLHSDDEDESDGGVGRHREKKKREGGDKDGGDDDGEEDRDKGSYTSTQRNEQEKGSGRAFDDNVHSVIGNVIMVCV